jgi:hypothetical protein
LPATVSSAFYVFEHVVDIQTRLFLPVCHENSERKSRLDCSYTVHIFSAEQIDFVAVLVQAY